MASIDFDALDYFEKLKAVGVSEQQARVQADSMRAQTEAIQRALKDYDDARKNELATKGDLRETELRLQKEIAETRYAMLKWQLGTGLALAAIMAKGFNWLGF